MVMLERATMVSRRRLNAWRAATTPFQLPMAMSMGARAREEATETAIMAPADICP
ncbi:hypothetical protein D3C71_2251180 [compost metagenome]